MDLVAGVASEHARRYTIHELEALRQTATHVFNTSQLTPEGHALFALRVLKSTRCDPFRSGHRSKRFGESSSDTVQTRYSQATEASDGDDDRVVFQPRRPVRSGRASWQLRGRESSDSFSQPISAPPSLAAQKSENFQKFYRAVVSPTHVRVTAGGRIVPNMRPTQPLFSWDKHNHLLTPHPSEISQPWINGRTLPSTDNRLPSHTTIPPYHSAPLFTPLLPPVQHPTAISTEPHGPGQTPLTEVGDNSVGVESTEQIRQAFQISPPSQFDLSRPFMYNGQLVYPLPLGCQPPSMSPTMPLGIVGNINAYGGHHWPIHNASTTSSIPFVSSVGAVLPSLVSTLGNDESLSLQCSKDSLDGSKMSPPHLTQVSHGSPMSNMFNLSDIIRQQISGLEQQVKLLENQLGHDKYQGGQQAQVAEAETQHHQSHRPLHDQPPTSLVKESTVDRAQVGDIKRRDQNSNPVVEGSQDGQTRIRYESVQSSTHQIHNTAGKHSKPIPTFRAPKAGSHAIPIIASPSSDTSTTAPETSRTRSRLTAAAAKAPPFKPRSNMQLSSERAVEESSAVTSQSASSSQPVSRSSLQNSISSAGQFWNSNINFTSPNCAPLTMPLVQGHVKLQQLHYAGASNSNDFETKSSGRLSTPQYSCHTSPKAFHHALSSDHAPYLMGFPPHGVTFAKTESRDLVYSRPLTDAEIRARLLYWGEAPHESSRGLPKFDGRDFYPPSPKKDISDQCHSPQQERLSRGSEKTASNSTTSASKDLSTSISFPDSLRDESQLLTTSVDVHENATLDTSGSFSVEDQRPIGEVEETESNVSVDSWDQPRVHTTFQPKSEIKRRLQAVSADLVLPEQAKDSSPVKKSPRTRGLTSVIPTFLQGILRRSPQHAFATPASGMLSATTAKAHLSQARGSAAVSLKSPIHRNNTNPQWSSLSHEQSYPRKTSRESSLGSLHNENRPPFVLNQNVQGLAGATDVLRKLTELDHSSSTPPNNAWASPSKAVGPVFDSSAW